MKSISKFITHPSIYLYILLSQSYICHAQPDLEISTPDNPLPFDNIVELIITVINYALGLAGLIAVVFIINGGIQYITSAGNEEKNKKATSTLTYAVIGLIIVFAAYAIKVSIENALGL